MIVMRIYIIMMMRATSVCYESLCKNDFFASVMFYPHFTLYPQDEVCLRDVENTPKFAHLILSWPHDPILGLADGRPALIIMTKMTMMMAVVLVMMVMVVEVLHLRLPTFLASGV